MPSKFKELYAQYVTGTPPCLWDTGRRGVVISLLQMRGPGVKLVSTGHKGRAQTWTGLLLFFLPQTTCPAHCKMCLRVLCRWFKEIIRRDRFVNLSLVLQRWALKKFKPFALQIWKCKVNVRRNPSYFTLKTCPLFVIQTQIKMTRIKRKLLESGHLSEI